MGYTEIYENKNLSNGVFDVDLIFKISDHDLSLIDYDSDIKQYMADDIKGITLVDYVTAEYLKDTLYDIMYSSDFSNAKNIGVTFKTNLITNNVYNYDIHINKGTVVLHLSSSYAYMHVRLGNILKKLLSTKYRSQTINHHLGGDSNNTDYVDAARYNLLHNCIKNNFKIIISGNQTKKNNIDINNIETLVKNAIDADMKIVKNNKSITGNIKYKPREISKDMLLKYSIKLNAKNVLDAIAAYMFIDANILTPMKVSHHISWKCNLSETKIDLYIHTGKTTPSIIENRLSKYKDYIKDSNRTLKTITSMEYIDIISGIIENPIFDYDILNKLSSIKSNIDDIKKIF